MAKTITSVKEDRLDIARPAGQPVTGKRSTRILPRRGQRQSPARENARLAASTRALFQYRRDDNTPDKLTTVHIDAGRQAVAPISPYIFGNFIEHLGGVVYQALWAQLLLNPNLERIEARDTVPAAWQKFGAASWQTEGYRSPRYIRLSPDTKQRAAVSRPARVLAGVSQDGANASGAQETVLTRQAAETSPRAASLWQHVALPAHRVTRYEVTLYARAPFGTGKIRAALAPERTVTSGANEDAPEPTPLSLVTPRAAVLTVTQSEWQPFRCTLTVPKSAVPTSHLWRFVIAHEDGQAVDVDQIEMFPTDSVSGFDPDVVGRTRVWGVPLLRYPGGNFASGYHWQDGVGPRRERPTKRNPAWGGIEPNHVGTDEFMTFARAVKAVPQLTVNAGDGTPEEAAAWVRYCNAPASDKFGKRRAANGAASPFNVKIWEVGNELYGGWQIGHAEARENAERFVKFRDAMLRADPTLRLIATGKGDEFTPDGMERDNAWNRALLETAAANNGHAPDWISLHPLVPLPDYVKGATYDEQYDSATAHPTYLDKTLLPDLAKLITTVEGPHAQTRIALTEWGIIVGGKDWQQGPNHDTLAGAIYNALALNAMLRNSDWVTLANMTALLHGGGIKKWEGIVYVDPQYYTQQMYTLARPHAPVATATTGPGQDVPQRGQMPAVADVPDVDVFAARASDSRKLVVFAVNRHRAEARPLRLNVDNFNARHVVATLLTASDPQARNTLEAPDTVTPHPMSVPAWSSDPKAAWQITLPPHSLVVLTLEGKG